MADYQNDDANQNASDNVNDKSLSDRGIENQVEGKTDNMKGKVKDAWGGLTGDASTQAEGKWDQAKGKVKDTFGKAERELDKDV